MANDYDYDYRGGRNEREYDDEPYDRGDEEPYYRDYIGQRSRYGPGRRRHFAEPYRRGYRGRDYGEPYGAYDYGRYERGDRPRESYYRRGYESEYREPYYRGGYRRGPDERGFFERAGDEIKSWFGDEEAAYRRRSDEMRRGTHAGRGPRGYQRSDERILEDINDRLTDDAYVDASDIEVIVNNSMVTLTGRVDSREDKRRSEDIAESVSGVTDVSNQLRIARSRPITSDPDAGLPPRARTAGT
ncbi:MAG TPA: BON domain-containing protein [Blastocatellia bacterium]|jgi:osmotically-inducible protein OsmY